jgi:hypothetical protein
MNGWLICSTFLMVESCKIPMLQPFFCLVNDLWLPPWAGGTCACRAAATACSKSSTLKGAIDPDDPREMEIHWIFMVH